MAIIGKFTLVCLAGLRNRHRSLMRLNQNCHSSHVEEGKMQTRAFVELISYVEKAVDSASNFHRCVSCMNVDCILLVSIKKLTNFASRNSF